MTNQLRLLFILLTMATTSPVMGQSVADTRITGKYVNQPLRRVIQDLQANYHLTFFYVDQQIDTLKISAEVNQQWLERGLRMILSKTPLEFYFRDNQAIVLFYSGKKPPVNSFLKNIHSIRGHITDQQTRQPLPFVSVYLPDRQIGTVSDEQGNYQIKDLPEGTHLVQYSFTGYSAQEQTVNLTNDSEVNIALVESPVALQPVEVSPNVYEISLTEQTPLMLTEKEILHAPNLGKDIARTLRTLPGIANNDFSAKPRIRGGSADETVFYLDNFEIIDPYHFEEFGGLFSVINTDYVSNVKITPGGFKAAYTDKVSGVVDIQTAGRIEKNIASLSLDLINSTLLIKRKLSEKVDVQFSGRRTYLDLLLGLDKEKDVEIKPVYFDLWGKVNYKIDEKNFLSFHWLHATDNGRAKVRVSTFNWIDMTGKKNNDYAWMNWKHFSNERYQQITTLGYQRLSKRNRFSFNNSLSDNNTDDRISHVGLLSHTSYLKLGERNDLEWGGEVKYLSSDLTFNEIRYNNFESNRQYTRIDSIEVSSQPTATIAALFLQNTYRISKKLNLMAGVRLSYFGNAASPVKIAPRLALGYQISEQISAKVGYGIYNQANYPQQTRLFEGESTPSSIGKQSMHYMANVTYANHRTQFMLNAYYKDNRKLSDDYQYDVFNRLGGGIAILDKSFVTTSGYSKGLELIARHTYGHKSSLSISYAYAINKIRNAAGQEAFRDNDRRHTFIINNLLNLKKHWTFSVFSLFYSGEPYTPSEVNFIGQNGGRDIIFYNLEQKNSRRLPGFYSLDVKMDKSWYFKKWQLNLYLNIINLTGHENVRNYFWALNENSKGDQQASQIKSLYLSTVFISPGLSFTF